MRFRFILQVTFVFDPLKQRFQHPYERRSGSTNSNTLSSHGVNRQASENHNENASLKEKYSSLKEVTSTDYYEQYDPILYQYQDQYYTDNDSVNRSSQFTSKKKGTSSSKIEPPGSRNDGDNELSEEENSADQRKEITTRPNDPYYVDSFDYDYQYDYPGIDLSKRKDRERRSHRSSTKNRGSRKSHREISDDQQSSSDSSSFNDYKFDNINCDPDEEDCQYYRRRELKPHTISKLHQSSKSHRKSHRKDQKHKSTKKSRQTKSTSENNNYYLNSRYKRSNRKREDSLNYVNHEKSSEFDDTETKAVPFRSLEGVVRVAFTGLHMSSTYLIRGSAGDVFKFRERGTFDLKSPAVYLVSRLRMLLPAANGRHSRRNR